MPTDSYPLHPGQTHAEPYYCTIPLEEYEALKKRIQELEKLQLETMDIIVNDFTTWYDCDVNTQNPGRKYYDGGFNWVLVKIKNRYVGTNYEIPAVARFQKGSLTWLFSIITERGMGDELKVTKWRPIY